MSGCAGDKVKAEVREKSFDWLLVHAPEPVLIVEQEGAIVGANPAAGRLCGRGAGALVGVHLRQILPDYQSAWDTVEASAFRSAAGEPGAAIRQIQALQPLSGPRRRVEVVAGALIAEDRYFVVELHDVTAREQALQLERLLSSLYSLTLRREPMPELFRSAVSGLAGALDLPLVLLARKQDNGSITTEAASMDTGLAAEFQILPERWDGTVVGDGPAGAAIRSGACTVRRTTDEGFVAWRRAADNDSIRSALACPLALPDGPGALVFFAAEAEAFDTDHSREYLQAVAARADRFFAEVRRLREQHLLARALECAGNSAFITDVEGAIVWSNDAFTRLSGYAADDVRGRNPRFLKSGKQGVRYYRDLWSTIRSGKVWSGDTVDRDRDGMTYTIRQTISPVGIDGRVTHYVAIHEDITRQKDEQMRRELRQGVDPVTGLLTRPAFEDAVRQALAEPGRSFHYALVSMRPGAEAGDAATRERLAGVLGERIRECIRPPHSSGVLGPGEYGLLLVDDPLATLGVAGLVGNVVDALRRPIPDAAGEVEFEVRSAIAAAPADGGSLPSLMAEADRQLADQPIARARRKAVT